MMEMHQHGSGCIMSHDGRDSLAGEQITRKSGRIYEGCTIFLQIVSIHY